MLEMIGMNCQKWRVEHGYYQFDVASEVHYSLENISAFEHGRNDNYRILLWYLKHGLTVKELFSGVCDE